MNYKELNDKIKELRTEDFIWIIYIGIIILSFYSNSLEEKYFIYNDKESKEKYRNIMILIFSTLIVVYIYFLKSSIDDINSLKPWDTFDKKKLVFLSFIASLFILISGIIYLYIAYNDHNLDVELAFN